jgi:hypothetical protein
MILFNLLSNAVTLVSWLGQRFCILTRVGSDQIIFVIFWIIFVLSFCPSIFYLLEIEFQLMLSFIICFFFLICVLWGYLNLITLVMSLDGWIKLTWVVFCVLFLIIFFQFHLSTLSWLRIELHNLFWFAFYGVFLVLWPKFGKLTQVDATHFFSWILFSITSFSTTSFIWNTLL